MLLARLVGGPLLRKKEDEDPGSGCLMLIILVIIGLILSLFGIGTYER